jgi:hypothetical protein
MVCGAIGLGGINKIRQLYFFLRDEGFEIINHTDVKEMDYSGVRDFRDKKNLSRKIVQHDLRYVKQSDVIVILPDIPSHGTAIEMFVGKKEGTKIILLTKKPIPTPWLVNFSDHIVSNKNELVKLLHKIQKQ